MSAVELCCVFIKELTMKYRVPAEIHTSPDGSARIHIQRTVINEDQENEIIAHAERLGLKQQPNTHWLSFSG